MEPRDGEHHKGTWTWLNTMRDFAIGFFWGMSPSFLVDYQFPAPIRAPFLVEIGHNGNAAKRSPIPFSCITLIGIVVSQQTVTAGV